MPRRLARVTQWHATHQQENYRTAATRGHRHGTGKIAFTVENLRSIRRRSASGQRDLRLQHG